jgi:predicted DsbA family dithiol-disulfide isomerase
MQVEVWSDVICPWCYIGKRRFEEAIARDGGDDVEVVFRPYQLDPTASPGKVMPVREAYARKFGGYERADQIMDHLTRVAAESGLEFHLDRAQRANTLLAHRLLWLAEHDGGQVDLKERLLRAYFVEGANVGDPDTLAAIGDEVGLDPARVRQVLDGDLGLAEVRAELARAADLEITAVPTYVFEGRWTVPGAQDPEVFMNVLDRVRSLIARVPEPAAGPSCTDDGCETSDSR